MHPVPHPLLPPACPAAAQLPVLSRAVKRFLPRRDAAGLTHRASRGPARRPPEPLSPSSQRAAGSCLLFWNARGGRKQSAEEAVRGAGAAWPEAGCWARAPARQRQMESWHSGLHLEQKCGGWQAHMWPWTQPCLFRQNNDRDVCAKYHNLCFPSALPLSRVPGHQKAESEMRRDKLNAE